MDMRQMKQKRWKSDTRKNFFTMITVKPWDRWPQEIIYLQSWVTEEVLVDWRSAI